MVTEPFNWFGHNINYDCKYKNKAIAYYRKNRCEYYN